MLSTQRQSCFRHLTAYSIWGHAWQDENEQEDERPQANGHASEVDIMYEGKKANLRSENASAQAMEAERCVEWRMAVLARGHQAETGSC